MPDKTKVQNSAQRRDAGVDGPADSDGLSKLKLTGNAVPGSHSAVFGLTPDGKVYPETSTSTTNRRHVMARQVPLLQPCQRVLVRVLVQEYQGRDMTTPELLREGRDSRLELLLQPVQAEYQDREMTQEDMPTQEVVNEDRDRTWLTQPLQAEYPSSSDIITTQAVVHRDSLDRTVLSQLDLEMELFQVQAACHSNDTTTQRLRRECLDSSRLSQFELERDRAFISQLDLLQVQVQVQVEYPSSDTMAKPLLRGRNIKNDRLIPNASAVSP
ncbi:hypothetical protein DV735_g2537, partial [Chaetothyriales sp. CBS 134920]